MSRESLLAASRELLPAAGRSPFCEAVPRRSCWFQTSLRRGVNGVGFEVAKESH